MRPPTVTKKSAAGGERRSSSVGREKMRASGRRSFEPAAFECFASFAACRQRPERRRRRLSTCSTLEAINRAASAKFFTRARGGGRLPLVVVVAAERGDGGGGGRRRARLSRSLPRRFAAAAGARALGVNRRFVVGLQPRV